MDNREENSRSTEQDRVANPVEETVSLSVSLIYFALKKIRDVNISKQCGSSLYPPAYPGCLP
jgi:hypothetical protein